MKAIRVSDLLTRAPELELKVLAGEEEGLAREILSVDVNRPGLALAGYFRNLAADRIQVFGRGENAYLNDCDSDKLSCINASFFDYKFPGLVFTHGNRPPESFLLRAEATGTPVLTTPLSTHKFVVHFYKIMSEELAPITSVHGVLIEVFGVGILLTGNSGIGKSETALELVERGHRLIADDMVTVKCIGDTDLYGLAGEIIEHHMELRGLGIINVKDLFGVGAIRRRKRVELVVHLEEWNPSKEYERLGLDDDQVSILDVSLPRLLIPVKPGRNVPILIETAAMNQRSKGMGYHAARELSRRINDEILKKNQESGF